MYVENSDTVSAFDAKTHLSQLLVKVQKGSRITITKHNVAVAMLVPAYPRSNQRTEDIIEDLLILRKRLHPGQDVVIEDLKTEGRR